MIGPSFQDRQRALDDCRAIIDRLGALHAQGTPIPGQVAAQLEAALLNAYTVALSDDAIRAANKNSDSSQSIDADQVNEGIVGMARAWTEDLMKPGMYEGMRAHLYSQFTRAISAAERRA